MGGGDHHECGPRLLCQDRRAGRASIRSSERRGADGSEPGTTGADLLRGNPNVCCRASGDLAACPAWRVWICLPVDATVVGVSGNKLTLRVQKQDGTWKEVRVDARN